MRLFRFTRADVLGQSELSLVLQTRDGSSVSQFLHVLQTVLEKEDGSETGELSGIHLQSVDLEHDVLERLHLSESINREGGIGKEGGDL